MHPVTLELLLPVGISFYTFQTISYVIDVYRGDIAAEKHFGYYAAFVSFFPQLVAGPIERTSNLLPQIREERYFKYSQGVYGLRLMLFGYFKKIVIADTLAQFVDKVYANVSAYPGFSMVIVIFFFTVQIYCDFSGYSDIAVGTAKLFGINLMTNFKSPYFSLDVHEFWTRWHISLSTWFRDYIYIPLGGNRVSAVRHKVNLLITFLVSGLWHGANWTFVLWGGVHGLAQVFSKRKKTETTDAFLMEIAKTCLTFLFCSFAWVLFRAQSLQDAVYVYTHIFSGISDGLLKYLHDGFAVIGCNKLSLLKIVISTGAVFGVDFLLLKRDVFAEIEKQPLLVRWMIYIVASVIIFLFFFKIETKEAQFIYFQF